MNRILTCPHCSTRLQVSEQISDKALICPHCLADVDNPQPGFQIRAADINTDVKRDTKVGSIILALLLGLWVLGMVITFFAPVKHTGEAEINWLSLLMYLSAGLAVLVGIAFVYGLTHSDSSGDGTPSAGSVLGILFLFLGTIVAIALFGFFACAVGVSRSFQHFH